jgi:hypothetical protein
MVWTSIRSIGYVVALVPIMSLAIAVIPAEFVDDANAWNNLTYRVTAALVLSVLNAIAATLTAQLAADSSPPRTALPFDTDPSKLLVLYEHFLVRVQAGALDGLFFIMTLVALAGALLALALPTGRRSTAQPPADSKTETTTASSTASSTASLSSDSPIPAKAEVSGAVG